MHAAGLEPRNVLTETFSSFQLGGELFDEALARWPDLDGVFCTNDDLAVGALLRTQARGIHVPKQIAVAGATALNIGRAVTPQLASIVTPRETIGREAAKLLLARMTGQPVTNPVLDVGFTLFEGERLG